MLKGSNDTVSLGPISLKSNADYWKNLANLYLAEYEQEKQAELEKASSGSASVKVAPPYVYILGAAAFQGVGQSPDGNYEVPHASFIRLDSITANRNLILKTPNFGAFLIIFVNNNNSSFNWIVSGAVSVKNPSGSSVTSLDNKAVYTLVQGSGASEWVVASKYNT